MNEKMKVIMLSGPSSSGKTCTFNKVYTALDNEGIEIIQPKEQLGANDEDFKCIIRYKGLKIAFFSMGDYATEVIGAMEDYEKEECDVLVCACNNHFKNPYGEINYYLHHTIIDKTVGITPDKNCSCNRKDKKRIIEEIKLSIK